MQRNEALLALNRITCLTTREKLACLELFADMEDFFCLAQRELEAVIGRRLRVKRFDLRSCRQGAQEDLAFLEQGGRTGFLFYWDRRYPAGLREIYDPPLLLFYRGTLPAFEEPLVAIVGTRMPTGRARSAAFSLAMELAERGIGVVSGLARGIDAVAHEGSLPGPGPAIAVLGNGIDTVYPVRNRPLALRLLESGGVIFSEFPPGTPPLKYNFPKRNRIISGLCRSVVLIQAPERSGALITADYALAQGRDIYVHQAGLQGETGRGTAHLAEEGAMVIENSGHLLYDWGWEANCKRMSPHRLKTEWLSPGLRLAGRLQLELAGEYTTYNGDFIRRG